MSNALSPGKTARSKAEREGALPPTPAMKRYAASLSRQTGVALPIGYAKSGAVCRTFLDQHAPTKGRAGEGAALPTAAWPKAEEPSTQRPNTEGSDKAVAESGASSVLPWKRKGRRQAGSLRKTRLAKHRATPVTVVEDLPCAGSGTAVCPKASNTPLRIPLGNKEAAQKLGVRYGDGGWCASSGVELEPFRKRGWM